MTEVNQADVIMFGRRPDTRRYPARERIRGTVEHQCREYDRGITIGVFQYLQIACLVESGPLKPRVRNRNRLSTCFHACMETVLRLCSLSNGDYEFAEFISNCPVNPKHICQVAVAPLVEQPHQPDTRLNRYNLSGPCFFLYLLLSSTLSGFSPIFVLMLPVSIFFYRPGR